MKSKEIVALIIGRGNNTLKDKNIIPVLGRPLLQWGALAAKSSKYIGRYYISSDCNKILDAAEEVGFKKIKRPDELSLPTSQSSDAVVHAYNIIKEEHPVEIVVVIHANVGTISSSMIDDCIEKLKENTEVSSVIPCHKNDEYHPYRAKKLREDGTLDNLFDSTKKVSANRQELDVCYFFDHSFWVLNAKTGIENYKNGQPPWPVMGSHILPYVTSGCFDVHDLDDVEKTETWIKERGLDKLYVESRII